jgi:molybdate transport system substrate-binding protein
MSRSTALAVAVALVCALLAGCGSDSTAGSAESRTLTVFAAASLTETFRQIGESFQSSYPGVRVEFNFGASSTLAKQITEGAPADVFAAASPATMKQVTDAGLNTGDPRVFVRNRLQIAVPPDNPGNVNGIDDLANPKLKVVICAVQVPCGAAAAKALAAARVKVTPASVEQDVKAALTKVVLGEADAALVYRTDVKAAGAKVKGIAFPEADQAVNDYPIVALAKAPQPELAAQFVQLVLSDSSRPVFAAAGFEYPEP